MSEPEPVISIKDLDFGYAGSTAPALRGVNLTVQAGMRCLLVGENGAGKTTLLRILGGRHLIPRDPVRVLGRPAFHDTSLAAQVLFLGGAFPFEVDVRVGDMLERPGLDPVRRERLKELLGVDSAWRMHRISDGQRRRVQLLLGLMAPYRVLLLDEITTDLDLLARADLLGFLKEESETRSATILYATHILDRLEAWASHVCLLRRGQVRRFAPMETLEELSDLRARGVGSPLSVLVEQWLRMPVDP